MTVPDPPAAPVDLGALPPPAGPPLRPFPPAPPPPARRSRRRLAVGLAVTAVLALAGAGVALAVAVRQDVAAVAAQDEPAATAAQDPVAVPPDLPSASVPPPAAQLPAATVPPTGLGGDAALDRDARGCYRGDMPACDLLYLASYRTPADARYAAYADSCAGRQPAGTRRLCTESFPG